jgi:hypothetical protein
MTQQAFPPQHGEFAETATLDSTSQPKADTAAQDPEISGRAIKDEFMLIQETDSTDLGGNTPADAEIKEPQDQGIQSQPAPDLNDVNTDSEVKGPESIDQSQVETPENLPVKGDKKKSRMSKKQKADEFDELYSLIEDCKMTLPDAAEKLGLTIHRHFLYYKKYNMIKKIQEQGYFEGKFDQFGEYLKYMPGSNITRDTVCRFEYKDGSVLQTPIKQENQPA